MSDASPTDVPDCQHCAACCFSSSERYVEVFGHDYERLLPAERALTVFHENKCFMRMTDGHCAALEVRDGVWSCSVYERRPELCRVLERGGSACLHELLTRGPVPPGS